MGAAARLAARLAGRPRAARALGSGGGRAPRPPRAVQATLGPLPGDDAESEALRLPPPPPPPPRPGSGGGSNNRHGTRAADDGAGGGLGDCLLDFGAQTVQVISARRDAPPGAAREAWNSSFELSQGEGPYGQGMQAWIREQGCQVIARFESEESARAGLRSASSVLGRQWEASLENVDEVAEARRWQEEIKEQFLSVEVEPGLVIVPWDGRSGVHPGPAGSTTIALEPGLAFGHGDHPTTRLCLSWLKRSLPAEAGGGDREAGSVRVIDYGSGSGVLAICALKNGAAHATATDCDELAVEMSRRNAELNDVGSRLDVLLVPESGPPPPPGESFDVLVANILLQPLLTLRGLFSSLVRPGGRLALSGILEEQAQGVLEAYSGDFCSLEVSTLDGWALVTGVRKAAAENA